MTGRGKLLPLQCNTTGTYLKRELPSLALKRGSGEKGSGQPTRAASPSPPLPCSPSCCLTGSPVQSRCPIMTTLNSSTP